VHLVDKGGDTNTGGRLGRLTQWFAKPPSC
jgi:hypothetical protein